MLIRKKRTIDELKGASEHLYYEIKMLYATIDLFNTSNQLNINDEKLKTLHNIFVESYTMRTRILLGFFYHDASHSDDILAVDFFNDPDEWIGICPNLPSIFQNFRKRVGKEIVHLTYSRIGISDEEKKWNPQTAIEMGNIINLFLSNVSKEKLGPSWP